MTTPTPSNDAPLDRFSALQVPSASPLFRELPLKLPPEFLYGGAARAHWDRISEDPSQRNFFKAIPFQSVADEIARDNHGVGLTAVWLGVGCSQKELQLHESLMKLGCIQNVLVHEVEFAAAGVQAEKFRQAFPSQPVRALGGTFAELAFQDLRDGRLPMLVSAIGATLTNFPELPVVLKRWGQQLLSGDLFLADFALIEKETDRRWPRSGNSSGDGREVCNELEYAWWQEALRNYAKARGIELEAEPKLRYQIFHFNGGHGVEVSAQLTEEHAPLNVFSFVRSEPEMIDRMLHDAGFEVQQSFRISPLISLKLSAKL